MRGDRPHLFVLQFGDPVFTPHARGSPYSWTFRGWIFHVYPACAGIDHFQRRRLSRRFRLPRMRGDRPMDNLGLSCCYRFTPHARGSTLRLSWRREVFLVYPACAGIDPMGKGCVLPGDGLPRMRGDRPVHIEKGFMTLKFTPHARGSTDITEKRGGK